MNEEMNITGMETSADMIMPLPLTEEQIDQLTEENYTTEVTDANFTQEEPNEADKSRAFFPGNPFFPIKILLLFPLFRVLLDFPIFAF